MTYNNHDSKFMKKKLVLTLGLAGISKLIKFSFIIGACSAGFSLINATAPLTVVFGGLPGGALFLLLNSLFSAKASFLMVSNGLPNFLAGLYWRSNSKFFKILTPVMCMALFWAQTWGTMAAAYALLWLIPVFFALFKIHNVWLKSLATTFVAHGVGSIIWLYFANLTNLQWFSLIPIAICERVFLAILMGFAYNLLQYLLFNFNYKSLANLQPESTIL